MTPGGGGNEVTFDPDPPLWSPPPDEKLPCILLGGSADDLGVRADI